MAMLVVAFGAVIGGCAFLGTSLSSLLFGQSAQKATATIKNEISINQKKTEFLQTLLQLTIAMVLLGIMCGAIYSITRVYWRRRKAAQRAEEIKKAAEKHLETII